MVRDGPRALPRQLAAELREWRLTSGRPSDAALIISGRQGNGWSDTDRNNWRRRNWTPACHAAGLDPAPRPYDLRHSFASLLLAEGRQALDVAQQLGHSPAVLLSAYAHIVPELSEAPRVEPELEIAKARGRRNVVHLPPDRDRTPGARAERGRGRRAGPRAAGRQAVGVGGRNRLPGRRREQSRDECTS
jgi:hypothetical protein